MVERALHPESEQQASAVSKGQGLADNRTIDENIAFTANTVKWGKLRQGVHAKKLAKNNGGKQKPNTPQQDNEILDRIFASLGVSTNLTKAGKERRSLDTKLRAAILGDLVAFENDSVETMQRMAGYWRYANRRTYNEMVRNNELWDWATGEKLPEIREEVELDVIEEEDENAEAGTDGETKGKIPENWDDPDFEFPVGQTMLSLTPFVDRLNTNGTVGRSDTPPKLDKKIESTSDEDREQFWDDSGHYTQEGSDALNGSPLLRSPLSPMTSNAKDLHKRGFQGVKDTRVLEKAIRKASPPFKDPPRALPPLGSLSSRRWLFMTSRIIGRPSSDQKGRKAQKVARP